MQGIAMVLPLAIVMALGYEARRRGVLEGQTLKNLNALVYWIAIPALLFRTTLRVGEETFSNPSVFLAVYVYLAVGPLLAWLLSLLWKQERKQLATSVMVSVRGNNIFMGVPAISVALGEPGLEALSIFLAISLVGINVIPLAWGRLALSGGLSGRAIGHTLKELVKNPVVVSCVAGITAAQLGVGELPRWLDAALGMLAEIAPGLALLAIGATLDVGRFVRGLCDTWRDVAFKLLLAPAFMWLLVTIWPVHGMMQTVVVLVAAMPSAVNNFILAGGMGMDAPHAGEVIAATTMLSMVTLPLWLLLLGAA